MQINRLFQIVYLLLEKGDMTAAQLAERFEVSPRTIYRDIDALCNVGIPVYTDRGKGGGIRLMPEFVLNRSLLSHEEQDEILFALQSLEKTGASGTGELLERLGGLFRHKSADWIKVDFSDWGSGGAGKETFDLIRQGILKRRLLRFYYYNACGEAGERTVEPLRLCFKSGNWYLQAYCRAKQDYRNFKLCRIRQALLLEEHFSPKSVPPEPLEAGSPAPAGMVALTLRFSAAVGYRVYDHFPPDQVKRQPDGGFLVHACYPEDNWVYGFLLSFGGDVTILEPPHVRDIVCQKARRLLAQYGVQAGGGHAAGEDFSYNMTYCCQVPYVTMGAKNCKGCGTMNREPNMYCQSCAMPLAAGNRGANADGSPSGDYCRYCYENGAFTAEQTMEQMVESCLPFCLEAGVYPDAQTARREMLRLFPTLKRWKKAD
jgi:predicted DNA-binding transcriptional regulator YafY